MKTARQPAGGFLLVLFVVYSISKNMANYVLLRAFDAKSKAEEFRFLFEMMGIDVTVEGGNLLVAEEHLPKAKELAEDYFKDML